MAKVHLIAEAQQRLEEARRHLRYSITDLSIPDEKIVELRDIARQLDAEVTRLTKKKGFLGFFGL